MAGTMNDGDRDKAYKALRSEATRLVNAARGTRGRKRLTSDRLRGLWALFPELRDDVCPDARAVLELLDDADRRRAEMGRFARALGE